MPRIVADVEIYELAELSELLSCAKSTLRKYIKDGKLRAVRIGRRLVVTKIALNSFLLQTKENEREFNIGEVNSFPNIAEIYLNQPEAEPNLSYSVDNQIISSKKDILLT